MNYARIIVISTTSAVTKTAEALLARRGWEIPVYECVMNEALRVAQEHIAGGTKVIVSRGGTAAFLRNRVNVPVVGIKHGYFDFAYSMRRALDYSSKIAIAGFTESFTAAEKFRELFGNDVQIAHIPQEEETDAVVKGLIERGAEVLVGGLLVGASGKRFGVPTVMIDVDEDAVVEAIQEAYHTLRVQEQLQERFQTIESILNCASEGIIGVDASGVITSINDGARKLIKGSEQGQSVRDFPCLSIALDILKSGQPVTAHVCEVAGRQLAMNGAPIVVGGRPTGAVLTIQEASSIQQLDHKIRTKMLVRGHVARKSFRDIIGESDAILDAKKKAQQFASVDSTVLLLGETGTGKELFAQSIHNYSRRRRLPFVAVNCGALPQSILESELFGYVKGAFTGARSDGKPGVFELAHRGTIFLDEITETSFDVQARLLRVIQEREITRMGDDKVIPVDVRVIAATNKALADEVYEGRFREDLYYRLSVLVLELPPLRNRGEDIRPLLEFLLDDRARKHGKPVPTLTPEAYTLLRTASWPGNVRELANVVERLIVLSDGAEISRSAVRAALLDQGPRPQRDRDGGPEAGNGTGLLRAIEIDLIRSALRESGGNKADAARRLGISQTTLWRRLKAMDRPNQ